MSMNIYLSPAVTKSPDYIKKAGHGELSGISIFTPNERPYVISSTESPVAEVLTQFVEELSIYESFPAYGGDREMGIYEHESAKGEIDLVDNGSSKKVAMSYRIRLTAKRVEDARELICLFRIGKLQPVESFQGPQGGKSYAELEAEVRRLTAHVEGLQNSMRTLRSRVATFLQVAKLAPFWSRPSTRIMKEYKFLQSLLSVVPD